MQVQVINLLSILEINGLNETTSFQTLKGFPPSLNSFLQKMILSTFDIVMGIMQKMFVKLC